MLFVTLVSTGDIGHLMQLGKHRGTVLNKIKLSKTESGIYFISEKVSRIAIFIITCM